MTPFNKRCFLQSNIKFQLPSAAIRRELFALHLPIQGRVEANFAVLAASSVELSGGDILNTCLNAIHAGSIDEDCEKWKITETMLLGEIRGGSRRRR